MDPDMYDSALLAILQNEGQISNFLDVILGFLYRRTDFYHIMKCKEDKIGFPQGVAPRLLIQAYEKYETLAKDRDVSKESRRIIPTRPDADSPNECLKTEENKSPSFPVQTKPKEPKETNSSGSDNQRQEMFQANPESHNGAIRDGYRWSQTLNDCDLRIQVPPHVTKGKQLDVTIKKNHIKIMYSTETNQSKILIDSDLAWEIKTEETLWSLVPKECVHINMEKVQERWWEKVFVDEPTIDTQKIDASMFVNDLEDGAQAVIDKLMYDEQQKRLGLPTSDEQKKAEILRKAWDAEGSPFKGTPFDPSLVQSSGQNL